MYKTATGYLYTYSRLTSEGVDDAHEIRARSQAGRGGLGLLEAGSDVVG